VSDILKINPIEDNIIILRNKPVLLDSDVAAHYDVETREINQAVKNNPIKFPEGYIIELNKNEWANLKSKFLTSTWGGKNKLPKAFTEKGLYMLATILKGDKATQKTIEIVETFTKIRELSRTIAQLPDTANDEKKQKSLMQKSGEILADLLDDNLKTSDTETSIELNLAVLKVKHTVKRK
jgi:phage regulator Rha-like protein